MPEFEDAANLLSKTVKDLKVQKKRLEIDIVSLDGQVKEAQRKLYHLGGNISMLTKEKETLEEKITEEIEAMKNAKSQQEEEIANKKNLAEIEIWNDRKKLEKEREKLEADKKKYLTDKQAIEIYELDLKACDSVLLGRAKDLDDKEEYIHEQQSLAGQKLKLVEDKEKGLTEERLLFENKQSATREKIDKELKETETKLKEVNDLLKTLNERTLQMNKTQRNLELRADTLNKKAFIVEGKERDLRKREILLQDREGLSKTHSVI